LVSGGIDVRRLLDTGKMLANAGALFSFEGNYEPNNWGVTLTAKKVVAVYPSWMAVAKLQRDF
jgi:hypothetical protein